MDLFGVELRDPFDLTNRFDVIDESYEDFNSFRYLLRSAGLNAVGDVAGYHLFLFGR